MIKGSQASSTVYEEDYESGIFGISDVNSFGDVLKVLQERKNNAENGGVNCIPLPFSRFRAEFPGIEQGQYVVITANQKTGKSTLASFLYVYTVLDYAFEHPDQCSCHIIYFPLEEAPQKIRERYITHLLYQLDGIRMTTSDLRSTSSDNPCPQDILDLLETKKYKERLDFFDKCVQFDLENTNPTGILRTCESYAKSVGTYKSHKIPAKNDPTKEVEVFDSYLQDDPNHYKIVIVDHIGLVDKEQGFRTKDSVDKTSEYFVKYLRNRYNYTCVAIQQQAADAEGLEAIKAKKMMPTASGLADSKYTSRDADIVLGLFDPSRFGLPAYQGYTIIDSDGMGLRNYGRFLSVIANRNGEMGGICPLFFDGAVCQFEELPRPDEVDKITKYYTRISNLKKRRITKALMSTILKKWTRSLKIF